MLLLGAAMVPSSVNLASAIGTFCVGATEAVASPETSPDETRVAEV
jgi:hypothetical protein